MVRDAPQALLTMRRNVLILRRVRDRARLEG
jgi:hypothetical protein